ncbi:MAG: glucose-6-phosphate isomerase [Gammaproteobacteria bacterium]|nr:MAG: glucose-6-phosphate isomerase [Gammaproteobacteria bacterium]
MPSTLLSIAATGELQPVVKSPAPNHLPAWQALQAHHTQVAPLGLRDLFADDRDRFQRFSLEACGLFLDYSKNRITGETMALLVELARQAQVEVWRDRMVAGDMVNASERRAALHVALRAPPGRPFPAPDGDVMPVVAAARRRMREVSDALRQGRWTGHSGKAIGTVVHIGIGGSHLGPEMAARALAAPASAAPALRFVSSVDAANLIGALDGLDAGTTLFVVASKSFSTAETMANAASARAWLLERGGFPAEAVARHFVAITANAAAARDFGIANDNVLPLWDWVGGRFSLCSAVGLPVAVAAGMDAFDELLAGAHDMDQHFLSAPLLENMPVILGLIGIWYRNFFAAASRAVLPYDYGLRGLPAYLQQLEMESAGKRVGRDGDTLGFATCPVVWGAGGNDGQHSFFQLLHQGSELVPCDFLVPVRGASGLAEHDRALLANALAQAEALMVGRDAQETRADLESKGLDPEALQVLLPHCVFPGNQPSNTLMYECLTPRRLGALIALYEHRLFVQSVCWGVNAFDQWGVELGKELAHSLFTELGDGTSGDHDGSTAGLLAHARRLNSKR